MESVTDDCLARHLTDVHGLERLQAGRLAQRVGYWTDYDFILLCGDLARDKHPELMATYP